MDKFVINYAPFEPFFAVLRQKGIKCTLNEHRKVSLILQTQQQWDHSSLCNALLSILAKNEQQLEVVRQTYSEFFRVEQSVAGMQKQEALAPKLRKAYTAPSAKRKISKPSATEAYNVKMFSKKFVSLLLALLSISLGISYLLQDNREFANYGAASSNIGEIKSTIDETTVQSKKLSNRRNRPQERRFFAAQPVFFTSLATLTGLILLYFYHYPRSRPKLEDTWSADDHGNFDYSLIGAGYRGIGTESYLRRLVDSLNQCTRDVETPRLDANKTVYKTVKRGGSPTLVNRRGRTSRDIYILEDKDTEANQWNPIAKHIHTSLQLNGFAPKYASFYGIPLGPRQQGDAETLEHLGAVAPDSIVFIFTNLHKLNAKELETWKLLRQKAIVCIVTPEATSGHPKHELIAEAAHIYTTATAAGIGEIADHLFIVNRDSAKLIVTPSVMSQDSTAPMSTAQSNFYVEHNLREALAWAGACAMSQPMSYALADKIRRRFYPDIAPEHINRIIQLNGTMLEPSGFCYSENIEAELRRKFIHRESSEKRQQVLAFIQAHIKQVEPQSSSSLAHHMWSIIYQRINLEIEPDIAANELAMLARTSLRPYVLQSTRHFIPDDSDNFQSEKSLNLTRLPTTAEGKDNLSEIVSGGRAISIRPYPLGKRQWSILFIIFASIWILACLELLGLVDYLSAFAVEPLDRKTMTP